ncbi:MAG: hypothetical protein KKB20_04330 [Proteobacteria bacterium]|nr:hypothetical protein [Pseudomonadota bacterium]
MSEYQYYEFLAVDRPLTSEEMAGLRRISTRASITPVSFTNEYNYGDLKADPVELLKYCFDAHVYVANWGTAVFMVRLPIDVLPAKTAGAVSAPGVLDFEATETHWIITWRLDESKDYDRFGMEDGGGWMARLAPIRDELLRGDVRGLYIGWLAAVSMEMLEDDDPEPLAVEGLGSLTAAQQALAEFLEVDVDLLAGAGMGRSEEKDEAESEKEIDDWLEGLGRDEVAGILKLLLAGQGQQAERTLKNRFFEWRRGLRGERTDAPLRTVGELWNNAKASEKIRLEREKIERERLEARRRAERLAYLETLAKDFPKAWESIEANVERGSGLGYNEACRALVDLSDAYQAHASRKAFQGELKKFMAGHMRRKALIERLVKAGLWNEK